MAPHVFLADAEHPPLSVTGAGTNIAWLPLTEDYELVRRLEGVFAGCRRVGGGPALQRTAERLRQPFLDAVTELGRSHNSLEWWTSRVSERNTQVSPLFLHVCWLRMAEEALQRSEATLYVVCDSPAVLEAVAERAGVRAPSGLRPVRSQPLRRIARFLARGLWHSFKRRGEVRAQPGRPLVLIRTSVDDASLRPDGSFQDRYFPGLRESLERRGFAAVTIPVPFSLKRSHRELWRHLEEAEGEFLSPEAYLRINDYLRAIRTSWRQRRLPSGRVVVDGSDVTALVAEDRRRFACDPGALDAALEQCLPQRLRARGLRPALVVSTYENLIYEKGLILGVREALPDTRIVGFQHGALSPLLLSTFVTSGEAAFAPLPDRVVCNGPFFRDVLVAQGLPPDIATVGPALRYGHLWDPRPAEAPREREALVTLPLIVDAARELLSKVSAALGPEEDTRVSIKAHPMLREVERKRLLDRLDVPARFEWVSGDMAEWLGRAGVLVALASSTLYEALAAGIPVVAVGSDTGLNFNPLGWQAGLGELVYEPADIAAETRRLLSLPEAEAAERRRQGRRILEGSFAPITPEAMRAFYDGLVDE